MTVFLARRNKLINHTLATIRAQLITTYNEIHILRQEPITAAKLRDLYLGIGKAPTTLLAYFDRFNADCCGITKPITFHVARHSWATLAKESGAQISVISQGLGHGSEKTTAIYLKDFDNSVIDAANVQVVHFSMH